MLVYRRVFQLTQLMQLFILCIGEFLSIIIHFFPQELGDVQNVQSDICVKPLVMRILKISTTHRIHGAAIYGNMDSINIPQSC